MPSNTSESTRPQGASSPIHTPTAVSQNPHPTTTTTISNPPEIFAQPEPTVAATTTSPRKSPYKPARIRGPPRRRPDPQPQFRSLKRPEDDTWYELVITEDTIPYNDNTVPYFTFIQLYYQCSCAHSLAPAEGCYHHYTRGPLLTMRMLPKRDSGDNQNMLKRLVGMKDGFNIVYTRGRKVDDDEVEFTWRGLKEAKSQERIAAIVQQGNALPKRLQRSLECHDALRTFDIFEDDACTVEWDEEVEKCINPFPRTGMNWIEESSDDEDSDEEAGTHHRIYSMPLCRDSKCQCANCKENEYIERCSALLRRTGEKPEEPITAFRNKSTGEVCKSLIFCYGTSDDESWDYTRMIDNGNGVVDRSFKERREERRRDMAAARAKRKRNVLPTDGQFAQAAKRLKGMR